MKEVQVTVTLSWTTTIEVPDDCSVLEAVEITKEQYYNGEWDFQDGGLDVIGVDITLDVDVEAEVEL